MPPPKPHPDDRRPIDRAGTSVTGRSRLAERPMVAVLAALTVVMLIAGIGVVRRSATSPRVVPVADRQSTTSSMAAVPARFVITQIDSNGTAPPSDAVLDAIASQLGVWANAGVVDPLRAGTPPPPLTELFTTGASGAAMTSERATLFVEGVPRSRVAVESARAALTTVAGPDAGVAVVVAAVELRLLADGEEHRVRVVREGEIVLVPEADGVWRIDGWRLHSAEEPVG